VSARACACAALSSAARNCVQPRQSCGSAARGVERHLVVDRRVVDVRDEVEAVVVVVVAAPHGRERAALAVARRQPAAAVLGRGPAGDGRVEEPAAAVEVRKP
jgi:hypothetical protein